MTKKYEILIKYIKDLSVEIPNAEAFIFSREYITKYSLGINITTKPLKDEMIEIITKIIRLKKNLKFSKNDVLSNLLRKNRIKDISFLKTNKSIEPTRK